MGMGQTTYGAAQLNRSAQSYVVVVLLLVEFENPHLIHLRVVFLTHAHDNALLRSASLLDVVQPRWVVPIFATNGKSTIPATE